jgi:hypothetical protein
MNVTSIAGDVANAGVGIGGFVLLFIVFATTRPGSNFESNARKKARVASLRPAFRSLVGAALTVVSALSGKLADFAPLVWLATVLLLATGLAVLHSAYRLVRSPED